MAVKIIIVETYRQKMFHEIEKNWNFIKQNNFLFLLEAKL